LVWKKQNEIKNKGKNEEDVKEETKQDEVKEETREEEVKEEEFNCEECDEQKSSRYCKDCETKQCEDCATHLHKLKKRKDHVVITLKEYLSSSEKVEKRVEKQQPKVVEEKDEGPIGKCLLHPDIKIAAYCRTCDEPICTTCLLGNHDGHKKNEFRRSKTNLNRRVFKNTWRY